MSNELYFFTPFHLMQEEQSLFCTRTHDLQIENGAWKGLANANCICTHCAAIRRSRTRSISHYDVKLS